MSIYGRGLGRHTGTAYGIDSAMVAERVIWVNDVSGGGMIQGG
jgi:hypothetical protein